MTESVGTVKGNYSKFHKEGHGIQEGIPSDNSKQQLSSNINSQKSANERLTVSFTLT
jgi:hypothetical protein